MIESRRQLLQPLFEPLQLRSLRLANRLVMSPMTRQASPGGVPGPDVAAYYQRRALGGIGLIVTEGVGIDHPAAVDHPAIPVLHGAAALEGWRQVVAAVHAAGGAIVPQLWHQGVLRDPRVAADPELPACRPSGLFGPLGAHSMDPAHAAAQEEPTRPMTDSEIAEVIAAYARSARHAMRLGFDGIAIHAGHGYLIDSFLWAGTNRRGDAYGGDHVERTRFAVAVVAAIRAAIGPDVPILFRFSQHKQQDYDARLAETPQVLGEILGPIADAGVDLFDASTRRFQKPAFPGSSRSLAGWARALTGRPSMTVGGVGLHLRAPEWASHTASAQTATAADNLPELMERFQGGEFDLVAVGRALLADPGWAHRLRRGEPPIPFDPNALRRLA